jgi:HEAT repeat protein
MSEPLAPFHRAHAHALADDYDARWDCVVELQATGSESVFEHAVAWCNSPDPLERAIAADVLGQLREGESTSFGDRAAPPVSRLLGDFDARVLEAAARALSYIGVRDQLEALVALAKHPDPDLRHGVVLALNRTHVPLALETLIRLSADDDATVRDWATFGLGSQTDADTPELRDALVARLDDSSFDVRSEALVGLARVRDRRVYPALLRELQSGHVGSLAGNGVEGRTSP